MSWKGIDSDKMMEDEIVSKDIIYRLSMKASFVLG
jgi:hypothetical protein